MLRDLSGHFLPAPVRAREACFWRRCLIMIFAQAVCKPFYHGETTQTSDAHQRSVSGASRFVHV